MKTIKFVNGKEISKEQLKSELKECGIPFDTTTELVRWEHSNLGIVFDTIGMYRKICGTRTLIGDLDIFRPYYDL